MSSSAAVREQDYKLVPIKYIGPSMWPGFKTGDLLLTSLEGEPQIGDIVFFKNKLSGEYTVHRIVTEKCQTKGDLSVKLDQGAPDIIGHIVGIRRADKNIVWGQRGQPLKKLQSKFSLMRLEGDFKRKVAKVGLYLFSSLSFLFSAKSRVDRI